MLDLEVSRNLNTLGIILKGHTNQLKEILMAKIRPLGTTEWNSIRYREWTTVGHCEDGKAGLHTANYHIHNEQRTRTYLTAGAPLSFFRTSAQ